MFFVFSGTDSKPYDFTIRAFQMNSSSGNFEATELLNPARSQVACPFPLLQQQLYSAMQPGECFCSLGRESIFHIFLCFPFCYQGSHESIKINNSLYFICFFANLRSSKVLKLLNLLFEVLKRRYCCRSERA